MPYRPDSESISKSFRFSEGENVSFFCLVPSGTRRAPMGES
jgi:hypothetical protein